MQENRLNHSYKKVLFCFFLIAAGTLLSAQKQVAVQTQMDNLDISWFEILSGQPEGSPCRTSYGFVVPEDGKMIAAYSKDGKNLWHRRITQKADSIVCAKNDFLYVTSKTNHLTLVNPSGLALWSKKLDFTLFGNIVCGADSRVFCRSKNSISCYGINSTRKWTYHTEEQLPIDVMTLNDGSLLIFLKKEIDSKSCAIRMSPFGTVLEEIVFQGKVINGFSCTAGVILVFSDNTVGMCHIDKKTGLIVSSWVNKEITGSSTSACIQNTADTVFFINDSKIYNINTSNGAIKLSFEVPVKTSNGILLFEKCDSNIIVTDSQKACLYSLNGVLKKEYVLPSKKGKYKWDYVLFIDHGYLTFLSKSWTINAFKFCNTSKEKEAPVFTSYPANRIAGQYRQFVTPLENRPFKTEQWKNRASLLKKGDYSDKEILWTQEMLYVLNTYMTGLDKRDKHFVDIEEEVYGKYDLLDAITFAKELPYFETDLAFQKIAELLETTDDQSLIISCLEAVKICGYDPTGEILNAIELLVRRTNPQRKQVLQAACDAIYELCKFMGRPALNSKGKKILSGLFAPVYDESTKKAARLAFEKLAELNM